MDTDKIYHGDNRQLTYYGDDRVANALNNRPNTLAQTYKLFAHLGTKAGRAAWRVIWVSQVTTAANCQSGVCT